MPSSSSRIDLQKATSVKLSSLARFTFVADCGTGRSCDRGTPTLRVTHPTHFGESLKSSRNTNAVPEKVAVLDQDINDIDANAEVHLDSTGMSALTRAMASWMAIVQLKVCTTLGNSASTLSRQFRISRH